MRGYLAFTAAVSGAALLVACPGGVLFDKGNAFPCDFSRTEPTASGRLARDLDCPAGFVCGVANRCQQNEPGDLIDCEGACAVPQMDGGQILPTHPGPIQALAVGPAGAALLAEGAGWYALVGPGADAGVIVLPTESDPKTGLAALHRGLVVWESEGKLFRSRSGESSAPVTVSALPVTAATSLRTTEDRKGAALAGAGLAGELSVADPPTATLWTVDGGVPIHDVGVVNPQLFLEPAGPEHPLLLTAEGFYYLQNDGVFRRLSSDAVPEKVKGLKRSRDGIYWTAPSGEQSIFSNPDGGVETPAGSPMLSTWALTGVPFATRVTRTWSDCVPCARFDERGNDFGHIAIAIPTTGGQVEVMCTRSKPAASDPSPFYFRRVRGLDPIVPTTCATEAFTPRFDPAAVNLPAALNGPGKPTRPAADLSASGLALAGKHGQLWVGSTLSGAIPVLLDRVPTEVVATEDGVVAITDQFFAAATALEGPGRSNLFTLVAPVTLEALSPAPFGVIAITSGGDVLYNAGGSLRFGPRLLNPRGDPSRRPYTITATADPDLYVITADDGLYLYEADLAAAREVPGELPGVFPLFTPEPNFPLRGVAIDRTTSAPNLLVRGFTLTARSVFLFEVQDSPRVARIVPLLEGVGEPVEVWMRSAQPIFATGRVGFRDGQIFTLPAGIPLANALPPGERVRDFAAMGPWPFVLSESGVLYRGHLEAEGRPLEWVAEKLPDGSEPWRGKRGKLFVTFPPLGTRPFEYRLYVFGEHGAVYKAAIFSE